MLPEGMKNGVAMKVQDILDRISKLGWKVDLVWLDKDARTVAFTGFSENREGVHLACSEDNLAGRLTQWLESRKP